MKPSTTGGDSDQCMDESNDFLHFGDDQYSSVKENLNIVNHTQPVLPAQRLRAPKRSVNYLTEDSQDKCSADRYLRELIDQ